MAYSIDGGETFTKYKHNPVIPHLAGNNRDPKVVWHSQTATWIMVLYLEKRDEKHYFQFLTSKNLLQWKPVQQLALPGTGECPDFFELPIAENPTLHKWIFMAGDGSYYIGDWNEQRFNIQSDLQKAFHRRNGGGNIYASQTWSNAPDNRRILIGWQQGDIPERQFNMSLTLPVEVKLHDYNDTLQLHFEPIKELTKLYKNELTVCNVTLPWVTSLNYKLSSINSNLLDIELDMHLEAIAMFDINGIKIIFDPERQEIRCDDVCMPLSSKFKGQFSLRLIADRSSIEIFAEDGLAYMSKRSLSTPNFNRLLFTGEAGNIARCTIRELESIWI